MRIILLGLALAGAMTVTAGANAVERPRVPAIEPTTIQPVYWDGGYCGPRCQEFRWRRHERWEARRAWRHRRWEERHYGYYGYPRY